MLQSRKNIYDQFAKNKTFYSLTDEDENESGREGCHVMY